MGPFFVLEKREARSEKREARSEKREARSEKREARSEKREARSEKREARSELILSFWGQVRSTTSEPNGFHDPFSIHLSTPRSKRSHFLITQ
ncbi:hypothetical protein E1100_18130 [Vibrio owensii]|nr:hypothetical protein E1100_18130 [Vibrio owensii]